MCVKRIRNVREQASELADYIGELLAATATVTALGMGIMVGIAGSIYGLAVATHVVIQWVGVAV